MEQDFPSTSSYIVPEVPESSELSGSNIMNQPSGSQDQESLMNDEEVRVHKGYFYFINLLGFNFSNIIVLEMLNLISMPGFDFSYV